MKLPLHSLTDLITNSSTVIYTYSDNSEKALREMIDEIFHVLGVKKKCDDVFTVLATRKPRPSGRGGSVVSVKVAFLT